MFHKKPVLRFQDSDFAFLVDEYPVKVEGLAYPGLYILDLVAELRQVGEGKPIPGIPVGDPADELSETEAEIETDRR